ncbi:GlxA family transcriptional regulator [Aquabacterium humicola]|uniref:GlxA family transcriptional regulator n=1 Tax=Aquabacterium humicola TaxID=3237377 RepID=UPI002542F580|nr:helix-turn-helix domain-containing protein [Rubrivivax pictus]
MPTLDVGLLLYPQCMPAGLFAAADLLQAANVRANKALFSWQFVALRGGAVRCAHGIELHAALAVEDARCQVLLVPGFWANSAAKVAAAVDAQAPLVGALRALDRRVRCWGYCTGVALLAAADRLRDEPATASWWMGPWLSERFPRIDWQWGHSAVIARRNSTASGTHGYQPIVAAEVERVLDAEAWRDIARFVVLPQPPPAPSVFQRLEMVDADPLLRRLRLVVERTPACDTRLASLAAALATTPRTLARKVKLAAGCSVGEHVRLLKLRQAGERLLQSSQTVAQVCHGLGYADDSSFRRAFSRVAGMTPTAFRRRYAT